MLSARLLPRDEAQEHRSLGFGGSEQGVVVRGKTLHAVLSLALGQVVELPEEIPRICRDPDDDRMVACAVAGDADAIVSGDDDLLVLGHVGRIRVLSPAGLLARVVKPETEDRQA
jgi:predicted nucleic acid-binding protein